MTQFYNQTMHATEEDFTTAAYMNYDDTDEKEKENSNGTRTDQITNSSGMKYTTGYYTLGKSILVVLQS